MKENKINPVTNPIIVKPDLRYITVLDFETGEVYQYKVKDWAIEVETIEFFIEKQGHNSGNCQWMVHNKSRVIKRYTIM